MIVFSDKIKERSVKVVKEESRESEMDGSFKFSERVFISGNFCMKQSATPEKQN